MFACRGIIAGIQENSTGRVCDTVDVRCMRDSSKAALKRCHIL